MSRFLSVLLLCFSCSISAGNEECGGVFTDGEFLIESPNYPNINNGGDVSCEFLFKGENCFTDYVFRFLDFDLENTENCRNSGLEIGKEEILCGNQNGSKIYHSENGVLKLRFYGKQIQKKRGFKILVTKSCNSKSRISKRSIFNHHLSGTYHTQYYHNPSHLINQQGSTENFCCASRYDSKHFIISSPNFPQLKNSPTKCVYHIFRANENICRLRLNFLFYWNGCQTTYGCRNGHLEIDGRQICGCRVGLKLTSNFDSRHENNPKIIKFESNGLPSTIFSGFVIEVIQDECSTKYASNLFGDEPKKIMFHNRYFRSISQNELTKADLVGEYNYQGREGAARHVYMYQEPKYFHETDKTGEDGLTYIETSNFNPFIPSGADDHKCRVWGVMQWSILAKKTLWQKMPKCTSVQPKPCVEIREKQGCLKSPGYPLYYPNNLNLCYRFIRQPGYCSMKLVMLDFKLEHSYQCSKDYFVLENTKKFCGSQLFNKYSLLSFSNGTFEDVQFVTDNSISCRGFKAWFEQLPCTNPPTPTIPTTPPITYPITTTVIPPITTPPVTIPPTTTLMTTTPPTIPPSTTPPITTPPVTLPPTTTQSPDCYRAYGQENFEIQHYGYEGNSCTFEIFKFHPDACALNLRFLVANLPCPEEYLLINGNRYCGQLNSTIIDFNGNSIIITYYRDMLFTSSDLRFLINATQFIDCEPEVEVVPNKARNKNLTKQYEAQITENETTAFDVVIQNLNSTMCGLIMNITEYNDKISEEDSLCNMLSNIQDRNDCVPFEDRSFYAPYINNVIKLTVPNMELFDSMKFKEVLCGDQDFRNGSSEIP